MRVLSWNLFHGRAVPPAGEDLLGRFGEKISSWRWDVALLQEVPPWWAQELALRSRASGRMALTSRNSLLMARRALARRWPDAIKSNGGGSNAILVRGAEIAEHRTLRLRVWPERRVAQLARLDDGTCVANFHGSARVPLAEGELARLWRETLAFAAARPLILGGDLNLRGPAGTAAPAGVLHVARRDVDHVFARGFEPVGEQRLLDARVEARRGAVTLSDHPPLWVELDQSGQRPWRSK